jgi:hypothetical protein
MMARPTKSKPNRDLGFTVYPDPDTRAMIDKMAEHETRARSQMALELIKRGIRASEVKARV